MSSWNSPLWKTKSPPVSPGGRRRKFDKLESSPNNRASCVRCGEKIAKNSERVGIQAKFSTPNGQQVWRMRYYHGDCVDDKVKRKLHLELNEKASKRAKVSTTTDKAKGQKLKANKAAPATKSNPVHKVLRPQQRNQLAKELRLLRKCFAIAQGIARNEENKIFLSRSIDEIIQKLPSNRSELMQCWGIKEKRFAQYGSAILLVVEPYLAQNNNSQQFQQQQHYQQHHQQQSQQQQQQHNQQQQVDNSDSDDEEVEITRQLTVEEIVAQRVREAEARGEVLEIL